MMYSTVHDVHDDIVHKVPGITARALYYISLPIAVFSSSTQKYSKSGGEADRISDRIGDRIGDRLSSGAN